MKFRGIIFLISISLSFNSFADGCSYWACTAKSQNLSTIFYGTYYWHTYDYGAYCAFLGIPYAEPPTGNLRFKPPVEKTNYSQYTYAYYLANQCMQEEDPKIPRSEDCLTLNIYVPCSPFYQVSDKKNRYPVMFWIHGGSFNKGNNAWWLYGADYIVGKDVILVTTNYRLGVFGFLSAPEIGVYGNMGLKDQRLALKWVHDHIADFEGDPNNITLFGESAGAASVHYLLLDNSTSGHYKRAILQSGSALNPWASQFEPEKRYKALCKILNDTRENLTLQELQKYSEEELFNAQQKVPTDEDQRRATSPVFNPVIEVKNGTDDGINNDPIITESVLALTKTKFPDIDLIIGINSNEGMLAMPRVDNDTSEINNTLSDIERVIPRDYNIWNKTNETKEYAITKLKTLYNCSEGSGDLTTYNKKCRDIYLQLMGDAWFYHGIYRTIKAINETNRNSSIYLYLLSDDSYSIYKTYVITNHTDIPGVAHADDLGYLFDMSGKFGLITVTARIPWDAMPTHKRMKQWWTNFAKTSDPNKLYLHPNDDQRYHNEVRNLNWTTLNQRESSIKMINITKGTEPNMTTYDTTRMNVWDEIFNNGTQEENEGKKEN